MAHLLLDKFLLMKLLIRKILLFVCFFASANHFAIIKDEIHITSKINQPNMPISKTFSLRLNDIKMIRLKSSHTIKLLDLYYEDSLGNRINLGQEKQLEKNRVYERTIKKSNLKKVTYTVLSKLNKKVPIVLDLILIK